MSSRRRIARLSASPLDLELSEPFGIATGAQPRASNVLVRIELEDGTVGLGEAAPFTAVSGETQARTLAAALAMAPDLVGRDVSEIRPMARDLFARAPGEPSARAAVEQALFDALSRGAGLPLEALFGGAGDELTTDMTVTTGDAAHGVESARAIHARGIRTLKVKVGADRWEADHDRLVAIRRELPTARLLLDANGGFSAGDALALLTALERSDVPIDLFEQPVAAGDEAALVLVARGTHVPICADESARSAADVVAIAKSGAASVVNLKIMKTGVVEAVAMWHVARAAGLGLMIGGMVESVLAMTFSARLASGLGGFGFADLDTPLFIRTSPFTGGLSFDGDRIVLPRDVVGSGVTLSSELAIG